MCTSFSLRLLDINNFLTYLIIHSISLFHASCQSCGFTTSFSSELLRGFLWKCRPLNTTFLAIWKKPYISWLPPDLRNFPWAVRPNIQIFAIKTMSVGLLFLSPNCILTLLFIGNIYSLQMRSSSLTKKFQKKNLYHDYPFQLLLALGLPRFPDKGYWGLVLVSEEKKSLIKRKTKPETVKH